MSLRRSWGALTALAVVCLLAAPALAAAQTDKFDPSVEFELDPYISIEIGPLDLSINKAVVYLCSPPPSASAWASSSCAAGCDSARPGRRPSWRSRTSSASARSRGRP